MLIYMKKSKIYISGPVTDLPNDNREAFAKAKELLEPKYKAISPFDLSIPKPGKKWDKERIWNHYMKYCLMRMLDGDISSIYMLNGWEKSAGACAEKELAEVKKWEVLYEKDYTPCEVDFDVIEKALKENEGKENFPDVDFEAIKENVGKNKDETLGTGIDKTPDGALRYNNGKPQLSYNILCPKALEVEARVWEYGAKKYSRGNWLKGQSVMSSTDSLIRHLTAFIAGENDDPETGIPHVGHIITCAKILANGYLNHPDKFDDRPQDKIIKDTSEILK